MSDESARIWRKGIASSHLEPKTKGTKSLATRAMPEKTGVVMAVMIWLPVKKENVISADIRCFPAKKDSPKRLTDVSTSAATSSQRGQANWKLPRDASP